MSADVLTLPSRFSVAKTAAGPAGVVGVTAPPPLAGGATYPGKRKSSFPVSKVVAWKNRIEFETVSVFGTEEPPRCGSRSWTRTVPDSVPSVLQSSLPFVPSSAAK